MYKKLREGESGFYRKSSSRVLKLNALGIKKFLKKIFLRIPPKVNCIKITGGRGWILQQFFHQCFEIKSVRDKKFLKNIPSYTPKVKCIKL